MNTEWSSNWKSSKETAKQRKYSYNAPLHVKRKFLSANLSDTLKKKVGKSSVPVRLGDEVVIKRGSFKGSTGEVIKVIIKEGTLHIKGIVRKKTDGTEIQMPLHPSNVQIMSMNLDDPKRLSGDFAKTAKKAKAGKTKTVKKAEDVTKVKAAVKDEEPKEKEKPKTAAVKKAEVKKTSEKDVKKTVIKKTVAKTVKTDSGASGKKTPAAKKSASAAVKKAGAAKSKK